MDSSEIDYSKENIQPLKEGRLTSYLETALNAQGNTKSNNEILKEREKFELELRTYKGNDPLEIWYNYICWVIQSYPNGGVGHLPPLLHKCLGVFKDSERYLQDTRYVKLWIKYIQMQKDPLETYEIAHKHGIGSKCAEFYKSWAEEYEKVGDFKGASSVFKKACSFEAQPAAELALYKRNFEDRVARSLAQNAEAEWDSPRGGEKRNALSSLALMKQGRGKKQHAVVGSVRIGTAVAGPAGSLQLAKKPLKQQNPSHFQIFSDQTCEESKVCVKMETLPSAKVSNRENMLKPGKWTQPSSERSTNAVHMPVSTPFKVHEEINSDPGAATPRGTSFSENVLKPRKALRDDFDCPVAIFEPPDPTKIPMYCKDKVYSGGVEFSLEEIRAIRYFEAERKRKIAEMENQENLATAVDSEFNVQNDQPLDMEFDDLHTAPTSNEELPQTPICIISRDKSDEHQPEGEICKSENSSLPSKVALNFDLTHIPSPTINTRAANDMMQELWSTTFTQSLTDSVLVMPQQQQTNIPKFEIPFDDTNTFQDMPDPEEKAKRIQVHPPAKFEIFSDVAPVFNYECNKADEETNSEFPRKAADENWGLHIPFVPPPEDDKEVEEDECKENQSPQDYIIPKQTERRPLAGTLVPSKNIPFQPLDTEEEECSNPSQEQMKDTEDSNDKFSVCKPFSGGIGNTSFEREIMQSLNDDCIGFEFPRKRKITISENKESGMISENGFFFSKIFTQKTIETNVGQSSNSGSNWALSDCENRLFPKINSSPPASLHNKPQRNIPDVFDMQRSHDSGMNEVFEIVKDPCAPLMQETLLAKFQNPVCRSNSFRRILQKIPSFKPNDELNLRTGLKLKILKIISNCGDAKFYLAVKENGELVVVKRQNVSCEWEFYIISEIRNRLSDRKMINAFVNITDAYLFNSDASMLLMEYLPNGSLLDVLNVYKVKQQAFPEVLVFYFAIDIINTVKNLHNCDIIHGAIKPENLLLRNFPNVTKEWSDKYFADELPSLQLTHLAKCIDMTFFPKNVRFVCSDTVNKYQCVEIQNGLPWSYQADLYGIAFTIHCMIFGEFMDLTCRNGTWDIGRKIPMHFNARIWNSLFHSLINISSEKFPDLSYMQRYLQETLLRVEFEDFKSAVLSMKHLVEEEIIKRKPYLMAFS